MCLSYIQPSPASTPAAWGWEGSHHPGHSACPQLPSAPLKAWFEVSSSLCPTDSPLCLPGFWRCAGLGAQEQKKMGKLRLMIFEKRKGKIASSLIPVSLALIGQHGSRSNLIWHIWKKMSAHHGYFHRKCECNSSLFEVLYISWHSLEGDSSLPGG